MSKWIIPIDKKTIRYNEETPGPYIAPNKPVYEQTITRTYRGTELENGYLRDAKIWTSHSSQIKKISQYTELHPTYPPFKYEFSNILMQCPKCKETFYSDKLHDQYDLYTDTKDQPLDWQYYDLYLCPYCHYNIDVDYEILDRPTLEFYASQNASQALENNGEYPYNT